LKDREDLQLFVFLLGSELSHLDDPEHWIHNLECSSCVIRIDLDGFRTMDLGVHPKILFTKDGQDVFELNGVPDLKQLRPHIKRCSQWQPPLQKKKL